MLPCSAPCNSITLFGLIHLNNIAATDDELTETSCWIHRLLYGWPSQDQFCDPPSYILYLISVPLFDTSIALRCTLLSVYWYYYYMEYILRSLRAAFSGAVRQVATVTRGIGVSGNSILSRNQGFPAQYCSHGPDVFFVSLATFHAMHIFGGGSFK